MLSALGDVARVTQPGGGTFGGRTKGPANRTGVRSAPTGPRRASEHVRIPVLVGKGRGVLGGRILWVLLPGRNS